IANTPARPRDSARLLVVRRDLRKLEDMHVRDIPALLPDRSLLIMNNSRVIPARLICSKNQSEILLLEETSPGWWIALGTPAKRLAPGTLLTPDPAPGIPAPPSRPKLQIEKKIPGGQMVLRVLDGPLDLSQFGLPPLPPYILKSRKTHGEKDFCPTDPSDYQTTYAQPPGSVAAPTAGLHFTPELLSQLNHAFLTLHVGLGTFRPIKTEDFRDHPMHSERYEIPQGFAEKVAEADKIIAVGTTSARVLESAPHLNPHQGTTSAFIYPPYEFKRIGGLMTNFHLAHSTLLLLVAAFAGPELTLHAYRHALEKGYRFYSFGDAMLIL
ncbi:MAG: tRNA preQ1(34) S-adenosylmethionine ribosyltransferase-isomerase QueA, partial [Verrucomicrobia bacterium]|nr:tRNA preQ1(34) S-adenosylmethionine ribosyltransferase-isomerase QueA [Verrucomicrobiota bacterium]